MTWCVAFFQGGFYLFNIIDTYAGGFPRLFTGIFELIAIIWVYGFTRFADDVEMMIGRRPNIYFRVCWTVVAPVIITGIVAFKAVQHQPLEMFKKLYPAWGDMLGWIMVGSIVCWIPIGVIVQWCRFGGFAAISHAASPKKRWGPALEKNRTGRYRSGGIIALNTLATTSMDIDVAMTTNGDVSKDDASSTDEYAYVNNAYL
ncbi:Sodium- and chloride-dependent glycine transporter 2 [Lamellibrachia satsuma]|nr:Sodium- and chloride-dependent glycine transporter 2 [Lamellibrachia satsuma]